ncbi:Indole-diterpene biosynthesis protein PaxU, putative [Penicillium digitatum]|uniref:Indole-diterpene biosynthesis protein PaxU, putative n=3 Tax=Penicillium digitatum TaxID=36651 RepID=K9GJX4_PEND2|nr:Indole-diterpene biosynthesis protein PaxU, putative [Penicillium digitatum Pd1]EKV09738.1 Indole-diterpene biosynthesis protein PaxU, putative [Penicillium digitatum Pd1]EKV15023.1 Indole-diterpene biosynthesis protein PaxU, putative [Penicillium digitatum PHI26]QQK44527.1 Indole-diterpene biosynthesis protein PaxU, putative [Penicillium digitatum]
MNAPPRALAKYVVEYRQMVPSARIIFVRSSSSDFIWHLGAQARRARIAPAVEAMRGLVTPENPVFVHFFSNGGMSSTIHLLQAWINTTGVPLPLSAMIIDSAPGSPSLRAEFKAFSFALPRMWILRLLGKGFLFVLLVLFKLIYSFSPFPDPISFARELINDTSLVQAANPDGTLNRCYIYSDTDELVDWREVESHAADTETEGWVVRREVFKNTAHVGHMRAESDRYWSIVKDYLGALVLL